MNLIPFYEIDNGIFLNTQFLLSERNHPGIHKNIKFFCDKVPLIYQCEQINTLFYGYVRKGYF